jgi:hypothetical protein
MHRVQVSFPGLEDYDLYDASAPRHAHSRENN